MLKLTEHHLAVRGEHLPPVDESLLLDYVVGAEGVFARGRRPGIEACIPIAEGRVRGLAGVPTYVQWGYPKVPATMLALIFAISQTISKKEPREALFHLSFSRLVCGGHVHCESGWHLEFPQQTATADHVEPVHKGAGTSEERALIEVHSHHYEPAFFSPQDDADEGTMSFRIYGVIGTIFAQPAIRMRVGLFGHFFEYNASEFFEMPEGVADPMAEMSQERQDEPFTGLQDGSVDAGLFLLEAVTPPGRTRTVDEIAFVCGCSRALIWQIEKRAKEKLRRKFRQRGLPGKIQ
jgi:hypothetical protein